MKKLICGLVMSLGLSFPCHAQGMKISQYPNTNNLAGTNLFLIAIVGSPGTNMNISYAQLSNLLAAAIGVGGAQVWTNDGKGIYPVGYTAPDWTAGFTGGIGPPYFFRTNASFHVGYHEQGDVDVTDDSIMFFPACTSMTTNGEPSTIYAEWDCIDSTNYNFYATASFQLHADALIPTGKLTIDSQLDSGHQESWVVQIDPAKSSGGSYIGLSTNGGGSLVFKADYAGFVTSQGSFSLSNATPTIPTAATLGAGGYWTGNSNGFLVTVYSLDGSTTVMKVLAP